jgi:hypothetical protein
MASYRLDAFFQLVYAPIVVLLELVKPLESDDQKANDFGTKPEYRVLVLTHQDFLTALKPAVLVF